MPTLISWLRKRPCEFWFGLASLLISLPLALPPFRSLASYANWTPGYYYVNYWEFGFVKRGLLGSLISLTGLNRLLEPALFTCIIHTVGVVALSVLFWLLAHRCTRDLSQEDRRRKPWLYAVFLTSPALFLHFGFDLGRVDLFGLNITLLALLVLLSKASWLSRSTVALLTTAVGLLSHEAFLFFWLPLLGLGLIQSLAAEPRLRRWLVIGSWLGLIVALLAILRGWGPFEPGAVELARRFATIHPSLAGALRIELTSDLVEDNIKLALDVQAKYNWWGNNAAVACYSLVIISGGVFLLRKLQGSSRWMAMIVPLTPLLMNGLGVDYIRHLTIAITAGFICSLLLIDHIKALPQNALFRWIWLPLPFVLMGPLGIGPSDPLPLFCYLPL